MVQVNLSGWNSRKGNREGEQLPPGEWLVLIVEVEDPFLLEGKDGKATRWFLAVHMEEVTADANQQGRVHSAWFEWDPIAQTIRKEIRWRFKRLAEAAGLDKDQFNTDDLIGQAVHVRLEEVKGRIYDNKVWPIIKEVDSPLVYAYLRAHYPQP